MLWAVNRSEPRPRPGESRRGLSERGKLERHETNAWVQTHTPALEKSTSELHKSLLGTRTKLMGDLSRSNPPTSVRLHLPLPAVIPTYKPKEAPSYKKTSERRTSDELDFCKCGIWESRHTNLHVASDSWQLTEEIHFMQVSAGWVARGIDYKPCKLSKGTEIQVAHHQSLHTSSKGSPTQKTVSSARQKTGSVMCDGAT